MIQYIFLIRIFFSFSLSFVCINPYVFLPTQIFLKGKELTLGVKAKTYELRLPR